MELKPINFSLRSDIVDRRRVPLRAVGRVEQVLRVLRGRLPDPRQGGRGNHAHGLTTFEHRGCLLHKAFISKKGIASWVAFPPNVQIFRDYVKNNDYSLLIYCLLIYCFPK